MTAINHATENGVIDTMGINDLSRATIEHLSTLPANELAAIDGWLASEGRKLADLSEKFHRALVHRYSAAVANAYAEKRCDTGTVHVPDPTSNNVTVKVNAPKRVEWDQAILFDVLSNTDPDTARHYAKTTITIDERKYEAAPDNIKNMFKSARTVKPGKLKFSFEVDSED